MAKFNQIQKERRGAIQDKKRTVHGDPNTRKLKQKIEPIPISGKRKRKLFKKWRREKKEGLEKGLMTIEDIEMEVADADGEEWDEEEGMEDEDYDVVYSWGIGEGVMASFVGDDTNAGGDASLGEPVV